MKRTLNLLICLGLWVGSAFAGGPPPSSHPPAVAGAAARSSLAQAEQRPATLSPAPASASSSPAPARHIWTRAPRKLTIIAHRGASWLAPEETMPAYQLAIALGADFLEVDLHRTRDGVLVVLHDDTLERTTDVEQRFDARRTNPHDDLETPDYAIEKFTWAELQQLDAGAWFNQAFPERARPAWAGAKIPRLEQVLELLEATPNPPGIYIETKSPRRYPGIEGDLVGVLEGRGWIDPTSGMSQTVIFQSFDRSSLEHLKQHAPQVPRVLLTRRDQRWRDQLKAAEGVADGIGPHGRFARPMYLKAARWNVRKAHKAGLFVHPYVYNPKWQLRLARFFKVDGVFTDRVEVAAKIYGRVDDLDLQALLERVGGAAPPVPASATSRAP